MSETSKRVVGVWTEWDFEVGWTAEGIARVAAFLVEGAAQRNDLIFRFVVSAANYRPAREMLANLSAPEGEHWTIHTPPPPEVFDEPPPPEPSPSTGPAEIVLPPPELPQEPVQIQRTVASPPYDAMSRWLLRLSHRDMRTVLIATCLVTLPLQIIRIPVRPIWRFFWRNGLSAIPTQLRLLANASPNP